jgi:uncharacterized membrane protein
MAQTAVCSRHHSIGQQLQAIHLAVADGSFQNAFSTIVCAFIFCLVALIAVKSEIF